MSEEKLYAVRNDKGNYWDFEYRDGFFELRFAPCPTTAEEKNAKDVIHEYGGHVVTLVEEPEKVVLSKEQAEIVKGANECQFPANHITVNTSSSDEEKLIMKAFINGYTVETENKYNLILGTGTDGDTNALFKSNPCTNAALLLDTDTYADDLKLDKFYQFTQEEIDKFNKDFWIKNIDLNDYKVEVTDDEQ